MNKRRMPRSWSVLVPGVVLVAFAGAAAAQTRPVPSVTSDAVFGVSKEGFRSPHVAKEGVQTQSPAQPMACPSGPTVNAISCGATVTGSLEMADCVFTDNTYYDLWGFSGTAGQQVTITLSSLAFDTYLLLYGASGGNPVAEDDDGAGDTNSRLVFTLPSTGNYFIGANSYEANQFGAYTVTLVCSGGGGGGGCAPDSTTHCLLGGRYRVTATFTPRTGTGGAAQALQPSVTSDTGLFWFFSANNIEIIIKVVAGCPVNNRIWVFSGGLTDVAYTITVTDTVTGVSKTYSNPQSTPSEPIQDTAFTTCT